MRKILKSAALVGLALTIVPPVLLFAGGVESLEKVKTVMLGGMLLWFATAIPWLTVREVRSPDREA